MQCGVILILKCQYTLNSGGGLVNFDYSIAGGHHHIDSNACILSIFRKLFGASVVREEIFYFFLLSGRHNKLKRVERRPGIMRIQFLTKIS